MAAQQCWSTPGRNSNGSRACAFRRVVELRLVSAAWASAAPPDLWSRIPSVLLPTQLLPPLLLLFLLLLRRSREVSRGLLRRRFGRGEPLALELVNHRARGALGVALRGHVPVLHLITPHVCLMWDESA